MFALVGNQYNKVVTNFLYSKFQNSNGYYRNFYYYF